MSYIGTTIKYNINLKNKINVKVSRMAVLQEGDRESI